MEDIGVLRIVSHVLDHVRIALRIVKLLKGLEAHAEQLLVSREFPCAGQFDPVPQYRCIKLEVLVRLVGQVRIEVPLIAVAFVSDATNHFEGVDAEYVWLEMQFGPQGEKWERLEQSLIEEDERLLDVLKVEFYDKVDGYKKGDITYFYFDITEFFMTSMEELFKE